MEKRLFDMSRTYLHDMATPLMLLRMALTQLQNAHGDPVASKARMDELMVKISGIVDQLEGQHAQLRTELLALQAEAERKAG